MELNENAAGVARSAATINRWWRPLACLSLTWLMGVSPAWAQEKENPPPSMIDLPQAARAAISWHPSIVEAAGRLNQQEQRIDVVRAGVYPQISGGLGTGYDSTMRGRWRPSANLDVSQRLFDFGKLSSELDTERAGVKVAEAQVLLSVDAIVRDTSYSMIELLRGEALLKAARDQQERVRSISKLVDLRYKRGAVTRSDASQTQSRLDAAQATLQQIEAEYQRWQSNLTFLLGVDEVPLVKGELPASLDTACQAGETDWNNVPRLREAQARLEQSEAQLRRERADRFPTVSLGVGGNRDLLDPLGRDRGSYNFGLRVDTGIFNGGASKARIRGADYAQAAARAGVNAARLEATRQLAEANSQVGLLGERTATLMNRISTMEQTRELYRLQYLELGTRTLVDLLNADQELSQIRFEAVNARYDLARLGVDCLYASGRLREVFGLTDMAVEGVSL